MFRNFNSNEIDLSVADRFVKKVIYSIIYYSIFLSFISVWNLKLTEIPNYRTRLEIILFTFELEEKFKEFEKNIETIRIAINQVKNSQKFKNIIEVFNWGALLKYQFI